MKRGHSAILAVAALTALAGVGAGQALASQARIQFSASNISGDILLTVGPGTDSKYPDALEVTGVSGVFTDTNNAIGTNVSLDIKNVSVASLQPINHATPESDNLLAPNDFSKYDASGTQHGSLSYDNLYWPGGAPPTASDYPGGGDALDIYGLMFVLSSGQVVNLWSDGRGQGWGVAVAVDNAAVDYNFSGVTAAVTTPETSTWMMMTLGFCGLGVFGYRQTRTRVAYAA